MQQPTALQLATYKELLDEVTRRATGGCDCSVTYDDAFGKVTRRVQRDIKGDRHDSLTRIQNRAGPPPEDLGAPSPKDPPDADNDGNAAPNPNEPNCEPVPLKNIGCVLFNGRMLPCFAPAVKE